jgi:hypothetical protein
MMICINIWSAIIVLQVLQDSVNPTKKGLRVWIYHIEKKNNNNNMITNIYSKSHDFFSHYMI